MWKLRSKFRTILFLAFANSILPASTVSAQIGDPPASARNRLGSMLEAINKIRERRDIKLDCSEYVWPFLGRSEEIVHYIDLFAQNSIKPSFVRQGTNYHVGFEIGRKHFEKVLKSKFGNRDVVWVTFIVNRESLSSPIQSCSVILKAAPDYL